MFRPLPLVTLTTDFGDGSSYVAAMKGAMLAVHPSLRVIDLSHRIPPQDLLATAYFLSDALPHFPMGTIHIVVVDPGVGSERDLLCVLWNGQAILAPDNGCWTGIEPVTSDSPLTVYRLTARQFWAANVSDTFHGRDILAPVAGHLALGVSPGELGARVGQWVRLPLPAPRTFGRTVHGEIVHVDAFGNLITNITAAMLGDRRVVRVGNRPSARWVRTYSDAEPGTLVALIGSSGRLELAVVCGSAAEVLRVRVGTVVTAGIDCKS